jgi:hypothetical protein
LCKKVLSLQITKKFGPQIANPQSVIFAELNCGPPTFAKHSTSYLKKKENSVSKSAKNVLLNVFSTFKWHGKIAGFHDKIKRDFGSKIN